MATYNSSAAATGVQTNYRPGTFAVPFTVSVPAAGLANGDVVNLVPIPANCDLLNFYLSSPALDSNGSPTITSEIGDGGSAARYTASTSTVGQSAVDHDANGLNGFVAGSLHHTYSAADMLKLTVTHAPATAATSGTIRGYALFWGGAGL